MKKTTISLFLSALGLLAAPAVFAAGPSISLVTPNTATAGQAVTFTASVSSGSGIKSCNLYVDLEDMGAMDVSGGVASKGYTFASGGSRIAFVFCKDNAGGMASGPNTSIWVSGAIVNTAPLTGSTGSQTTTQTPVVQPTVQQPVATQVFTDAHKLIKLDCPAGASVDHPCKAVYYIGTDGKRHAFPSSKVFFTWYSDFSAVETVSAEKLASYPLGKNVLYRPGVRMVKFTTLDKVYAVGANGLLRWVATEAVAKSLYGTDWNKRIDDLPDTSYLDYSFGPTVASLSEFNPAEVTAAAPTFD